jgi:alkylhydroperoxidase family enzyme
MARVPYRGDPGERLNLHRVLAHSAGASRTHALAAYIRHESSVDPRLREMAIIQVGYVRRCAYEYLHHVEIGRRYGVSASDVADIAKETAGRETSLDPLAKAVLAAAREAAVDGAVSAGTVAALRRGLDDEQLVDLVLAIAFYTFTVCVLESLDVELEPEYERLASELPFPD